MNNTILNMIKSSGDPQAMIMNMLQSQSNNNPIMGNLLNMVNCGNAQGIENLARNLAKEKGINIDELYKQIKNNF